MTIAWVAENNMHAHSEPRDCLESNPDAPTVVLQICNGTSRNLNLKTYYQKKESESDAEMKSE